MVHEAILEFACAAGGMFWPCSGLLLARLNGVRH
jgi:hypothetical protein